MSNRRTLRVITLVAGSITVLALAVFLGVRHMPQQVADGLNRTGLEGCLAKWYPEDDRETCVENAMLDSLKARGPAALAEFERVADRHPESLGGSCHTRMHGSGYRYARSMDIGRDNVRELLPASDDVNCTAGYLHALMLAAVDEQGVDDASALVNICSANGTPLRAKNCVHGLGHVFMRSTKSSLDKSIGLCRTLGSRGADCAPGVYHEFTFAAEGAASTPPADVTANSPQELCGRRALPQLYITACWVRAMQVGEFREAAPGGAESAVQCEPLRAAQRSGCYTSAGWVLLDGEMPVLELAQHCAALRPDDAMSCLRSGARRGPDMSVADLRDVVEMCAGFGSEAAACAEFWGHVGGFFLNRDVSRVCRAAGSAALVRACERGSARRKEPLGIF